MLKRFVVLFGLVALLQACKATGTPPESTASQAAAVPAQEPETEAVASTPPQGESADAETANLYGSCALDPNSDPAAAKPLVDASTDACFHDQGYSPAVCRVQTGYQCVCVMGGIGC